MDNVLSSLHLTVNLERDGMLIGSKRRLVKYLKEAIAIQNHLFFSHRFFKEWTVEPLSVSQMTWLDEWGIHLHHKTRGIHHINTCWLVFQVDGKFLKVLSWKNSIISRTSRAKRYFEENPTSNPTDEWQWYLISNSQDASSQEDWKFLDFERGKSLDDWMTRCQ